MSHIACGKGTHSLRHLIKSKVFLFIVITIVLLVTIALTADSNSKLNWIGNIFSVPLSPVQKLFSTAGQKIDEAVSFFKDIEAIKTENEELRKRVSELERENRELEAFKEKNEELRKALNLKDRFAEYTIIGSNVIAKDAGNWFDIFRIDVGTRDGIKGDMPVVTNSRGLVGRILTSDITSSKVISIIDEDSQVAGWISKTGGHVIVRGDYALKDEGLCRMDYIAGDIDVKVGDIIETSGLGGIYPKGIVIGEVKEIRMINSEFNRYAIIEPAVDFKSLEEVYVLKNK